LANHWFTELNPRPSKAFARFSGLFSDSAADPAAVPLKKKSLLRTFLEFPGIFRLFDALSSEKGITPNILLSIKSPANRRGYCQKRLKNGV
jgi:hypothetical protein